jgi:hypothetical protein
MSALQEIWAMAEPVRFRIVQEKSLWTLYKGDNAHGEYSHVDKATHEAIALARELKSSGQPATVEVHAQGKVIEVDTAPEAINPDLANNAADFVRQAPL